MEDTFRALSHVFVQKFKLDAHWILKLDQKKQQYES